MTYTEHARERRQCTALRRDGERCGGWAMWDSAATDDTERVCAQHGGRGHRGPQRARSFEERWNERSRHATYPPCTCAAYAWPHRPGGGLCRWPDAPLRTSTTPAGTRSFFTRWRRRRHEQSGRWYGTLHVDKQAD